MRTFTQALLISSLLSILCLSFYGTRAQVGVDKVVLRDGEEITGRFKFLNETEIQINGKRIERSRIQTIFFSPVTMHSLSDDVKDDMVVKRDDSRSSGHVTQVTNEFVIQNGSRLKRADVAAISLADKLHTVSAVPKESPMPSPSVSPSPSEEIVAGEESDSANSKEDSGSGKSGDSKKGSDNGKGSNPPWFYTGGSCNNKQRAYIFAGGYGLPNHSKTLCFLYIHICSLKLRRNTEEAPGFICRAASSLAQPTFCCDEFHKTGKDKINKLCDPMKDADCDGTPNEQDEDPLNPKKN
jgi:hypothetical protein